MLNRLFSGLHGGGGAPFFKREGEGLVFYIIDNPFGKKPPRSAVKPLFVIIPNVYFSRVIVTSYNIQMIKLGWVVFNREIMRFETLLPATNAALFEAVIVSKF